VALAYFWREDSMMARSVLWGAAGAAALLAATLATADRAEAACAGYFVGEATGLFYTTTGISARSDWRSQVRRRLGNEYAFWSRARDRATRCRKPEGGGSWYCRARARPCNG
jgi:hypothetical protein